MTEAALHVGVVTIGQSPRVDVVPDMAVQLGQSVQFAEAGALDLLDNDQIDALAPRHGEAVLATRLRDGREVRIAHSRVVPLLADAVDRVRQRGTDLAVLLCTGSFSRDDIPTGFPLLTADQALIGTATTLAAGRNLLVVCPDRRQAEEMRHRWQGRASVVHVVAASPYGSLDTFRAELERAAQKVQAQSDGERSWLAVLDCVGYNHDHRALVRSVLGLPAVIARSAIAHLLAQLA